LRQKNLGEEHSLSLETSRWNGAGIEGSEHCVLAETRGNVPSGTPWSEGRRVVDWRRLSGDGV